MINHPVFFDDGGYIINSKARDILGHAYTVAVINNEAFEELTTYYMNTDIIEYPSVWSKTYDDNGFPLWRDLLVLSQYDELARDLYVYILGELEKIEE